MIKMYKDGKVISANLDQRELMEQAGWSCECPTEATAKTEQPKTETKPQVKTEK